jgi:signal transduction histidine kinase
MYSTPPVGVPGVGATRARRLALPAVIALLGIVLSVVVHDRLLDGAETRTAARLEDSGAELLRVADDLEAIAVGQVLAIRGLFEASVVVTPGEFEHFVDVIGEPGIGGLAFAPRVLSEDMKSFVVRTRTHQPDYEISSQPLPGDALGEDLAVSGRVHWPIVYRSQDRLGFPTGFDLGSVPELEETIQAALLAREPIASGFVAVPGGEAEGDLLVVAPIRYDGEVIGIAVRTLRLDDVLASRVEAVFGSPVTLHLYEAEGLESSFARWVPGSWRRTLEVAGRRLVMFLVPATTQVSGPATPDSLLVLGIAMSLLVGWLVHTATRRRAIARELAALQRTLAGKDRFLASVSHELRTPLTAVVGNLEILSSSGIFVDEAERDSLVKDARDSALDLERLVEDHLTAARLSAGVLTMKSEVVDMDRVVARVVDGLNLSSRITVKCGTLGSVSGDGLRIRQIIRNILRNASAYAASEIELRAVRQGRRVGVEILNDGQPVSPAILDRLFDPFVGENSPGQPESIGLGLAISRDLARRMGGDLSYSYSGGRVCFTLSLQAAALDPQHAETGQVIKL